MAQTTAEKIAALRDRRERARNQDPVAIARQHERGKLTARERIDRLLDPGSFVTGCVCRSSYYGVRYGSTQTSRRWGHHRSWHN